MHVVHGVLDQAGAKNLRRFARFNVALPVLLKSKSGHKHLISANISRTGLFIRSDKPPAERQLIQLSVDLGDQGVLDVVGMVVHCFAPGDPHPEAPGMGVEYFAMSKAAKKTWDRFCLDQDRALQNQEACGNGNGHDTKSSEPPVVPAFPVRLPALAQTLPELTPLPGTVDVSQAQATPQLTVQVQTPEAENVHPQFQKPAAIAKATSPAAPKSAPRLVTLQVEPHQRRNSQRFAAVFSARLSDQKQFHEFLTRDISLGGTFLRSETLVPEGSRLELVLIHPATMGEFEIVATVVRLSQGGAKSVRGMGVSFAPLSERAQADFERFVASGIASQAGPSHDPDSEEIVLLEDILEFDAGTPRAHTNIARIFIEQLKDPVGAIVELKKALEAQQDYLPAHRLLQLAYALEGDTDKAYEHIQAVVRLRGSDSD